MNQPTILELLAPVFAWAGIVVTGWATLYFIGIRLLKR